MAEETQANVAPSLKITGLHIAGYRSIKRLDWPEDGLGWDGTVPDIVLVGGANGSGKTTLLEGLFSVFAGLADDREEDGLLNSPEAIFPGAREVRLDLGIRSEVFGGTRTLQLAIGDDAFLQLQASPNCYLIRRRGPRSRTIAAEGWREFLAAVDSRTPPAWGVLPGIAYFPSDRKLVLPEPGQLSFGLPRSANELAWRFTPATSYEQSLTSQLYQARFYDLNQKEDGRPELATRFAAYADAFHRFVGGGKELVWHEANLTVRTADGAMHGLPELSSGEKQVLIFAAELNQKWTPGSLILIDEPELHLHEAWQSILFELIRDLQRERGGQAIIATQSNHLFGLGDPGSKVVLRKGWP